ncbi:MAG: ABC transporter substrate-binding protein [Bacteroidota bacterium]
METTVKSINYFILLLLLGWNSLQGQSQFKFNDVAEKKFLAALREYEHKDYADAALSFENLVSSPFHQRTTASGVMLGKTYLRLNQHEKTISFLKKFLLQYPHSRYVDGALYTLGIAYSENGSYEDAAYAFLTTMEITNDSKTSRRALSRLEQIVVEKIPEQKILSLITKQTNQENRILLKLLLTSKQYKSAEFIKAKSTLEPLIKEAVDSKYRDKVNTLVKKLEREYEIKIGVLLPLMKSLPASPFREIGEELLKGIQFAVDEFNSRDDTDFKIVLEVIDTERNVDKAANAVKNLSNKKDLLAIIGPVFSNEVQACVPIADEYRIPLITPTATANGLASAGEFVFQTNPDFNTRGRAMATFAIKDLGLVNLAVVSPNEPSNKSMTESFILEAHKLGGNVIAVEWYQKGVSDLSDQFKNLREIGLTSANEPMISFGSKFTTEDKIKVIKAGAEPRLVDSLLNIGGCVGINSLFGKRGKRIADSLNLKYYLPSTRIDSMDIPVNSIHGIFFPVSTSEEIGIILPQLSYYNIRTQVLGSSEWYDERKLEQNAVYANGSIFFTESFVDYQLKVVSDFLRRFQKQVGDQPTNNCLFGYDAMSLIVKEIKQSSITREKLKLSLSRVKGFQGVHSKINLQNQRVNSELQILKYLNGNIIKIGEVSVSGN